MEFKIKSSILRDALGKILSITDRKILRPLVSNFLITIREQCIELLASGLEVSAKINIPCQEIISSGKFCINPRHLYDILKKMPDGIIELRKVDIENVLIINYKKIKFSLLIGDPYNFISPNFQSNSTFFSLKGTDLLTLIQTTYSSMSTDESTKYLNGIFLQQINSRLRAVATDGHRMALVDLLNFSEENNSLTQGIIIPRKGVSEIKKMADADPSNSFEIAVDETSVYLKFKEEFFLSIRLVARDFPQFHNIIPQKNLHRMTVNRDVLVNSLNRIRLFANEKSNAIKFTLKEGSLILSASNFSIGRAQESIEINYKGENLDICFNSKYLAETINSLNYPELTFEFNEPSGPFCLKSSYFPEYLGIIMPIKMYV